MAYDLKSEEDVRLYLDNLYTEYKFGCYGEKKGEVCHLLGDYEESVNRNFQKAAELYKSTCDNLEYNRSCAKFGNWSLIGKGCTKDIQGGYRYLKRACALDDETGCTNAGIVAIATTELHGTDRVGVIKDAIAMLEKSCTAKHQERACSFLSALYHRGIEGVAEPDPVQIYKYALKACEFGNYMACNHVSQLHARGEGAQQSDQLAEQFRLRAKELERQIKQPNQTLTFSQGIQM